MAPKPPRSQFWQPVMLTVIALIKPNIYSGNTAVPDLAGVKRSPSLGRVTNGVELHGENGPVTTKEGRQGGRKSSVATPVLDGQFCPSFWRPFPWANGEKIGLEISPEGSAWRKQVLVHERWQLYESTRTFTSLQTPCNTLIHDAMPRSPIPRQRSPQWLPMMVKASLSMSSRPTDASCPKIRTSQCP